MIGANARQLAVASLTEAGDAARNGPPLQGYVLITGEGTDCRVTVYLQRGDGAPATVLAGDMVWLQTQAQAAPPAEAGPVETGFKLYPEPATPVSAIPPHKIEVVVTPVADDEGQGASAGPEPGPEPETGPQPGAPSAEDEPAATSPPPPATAPGPEGASSPVEAGAVTLHARHPALPRAWGIARMDIGQGLLTLSVRGLPSPTALGPSYTGYQAWLLNQRAGTREPIGPLTRAWGDNFRLESETGLPLSRFDAITVTATDRQGQLQNPPQVLFGTYA